MMDEQRPGKRLRTEDEPRASGGSAPAGGGSAASGGGGTATPTKANTMASLRTTLGPRYEAAVEPLASLPDELHLFLIPEIKGMLSDVVAIRQRQETVARNRKPMLDRETGNPLRQLSAPDDVLPFIPSCLRRKMPLAEQVSELCKDDPDMQQILREADAYWEAHAKIGMAEFDIRIKEREVEKRRTDLRARFLGYIGKMSLGVAGQFEEEDGEVVDGVMSIHNLAHAASHVALGKLSAAAVEALGFPTALDACAAYCKQTGYKPAESDTFETEGDRARAKLIAETIGAHAEATTVGVWEGDKKKDVKRAVNAKIRLLLAPPKIAQATQDVRSALDGSDSSGPSEKILEAAKKAARDEAKKQTATMLKTQRKKSLGSTETQVQTPTKRGLKSGKGAGKSSEQRGQQRKQRPAPKSALKKQTRFQGDDATPTKRSRKPSGDRGGGKGGGRSRGAGRR